MSAITHDFIINGLKVTVEAEYWKGFKGSLEEPAEPAWWDIERIWIQDIEIDDLDETATMLNYFTWYELEADLNAMLNEELDQYIKFNY
jgi:hypothetical protein